MSEILVRFDETVTDPSGVRYFPQAVGRQRRDGLWEGWLEFVAVGNARNIESGRETTQPNRVDTEYWATGLTYVYLEGSLRRALRRPAARCNRIVVSDRSVPESRPYFSFPSPERVSDPMSRMFCASFTSEVGRSFAYRASSAAAASSGVMFPSSFT